ncbi:MAG: hypothetical protein FD123_3187 [Bacteroidetes bacterium]|nr:MAG: hypothetical protein FD123_3187 [Bacteroidota bacterium]
MGTRILLFFLLISLLFPAGVAFAQQNDTGTGDPATSFITPDDTASKTTSVAAAIALEEEKKKVKEELDRREKIQEEKDFFTAALDRFSLSFFIRLFVDLLSMVILVRFIYYPVYKKRDYFFTFFMFNLTIFVITFLLNTKSGFSMGAAFGLFAVFSLLRYRTEDISARDMTYLFTVIALGLMSSVNKGNVMELVIINAIILAAAFILDGNILMKTEFVKNIQYENIELIKPENHTQLLEDLRARTGLNIHKISIGRVDFVRDTATIKIYYYDTNKNQDA